MKYLAIAVTSILAGCAMQLTLLPRAPGTLRGAGVLDKLNYTLTVQLGDRTFEGRMNVLSGGRAIALLLAGDAQLRCDIDFTHYMASGNGICVDGQSIVYDLILR